MLDEFVTERLIVVRTGEDRAEMRPGCLASTGELLDIIHTGKQLWFWKKWRPVADRVRAAQAALRAALLKSKRSRIHDVNKGADLAPLGISRDRRVYWPLGYPQNARFLDDEEAVAEPEREEDSRAS